MLADTEGTIREIATFLEIPIQEELLPGILQAVSMEGMRNNLLCVPAFLFEGGAKSFVNKGTNGRWKGVLTEEQLAKYDAKVKEKLSPDCAAWLENGRSGYDPRN
jgi:aryl sulfotransferase